MTMQSNRLGRLRVSPALLILTVLLVLLMTSWTSASEPLQNIEKVQGGYFLTDENIIALANYIQELQDENVRLLATVEALNVALQEERVFVDRLLAEKDKVISLQEEQIKDLEFVYENSKPTLFDKATLVLGGAGVAMAILLLAKTL